MDVPDPVPCQVRILKHGGRKNHLLFDISNPKKLIEFFTVAGMVITNPIQYFLFNFGR